MRFTSIRGSFFSFSPAPLPPALPYLLASNNPPPPGRGTRRLTSISDSQRRHDQPASRHISSVYSLRSFAIARSCSLLLASSRFYSLLLIPARFRPSAAFRSPSRFSYRTAGRGANSVSPVLRSPPASIDMGKAGRGYRLADFSSSRRFAVSSSLLACGSFFSL